MPGWWPQVRAALVALHLAAITLSALPSPEGGLNRGTWSDPTVQAEFKAWSARFGMDKQAFEDQLWVFATGYGRAYKKLLTPVDPYEELVGSEQGWKMFIAPHRFPTRLEIAGRAKDGAWDVLFYESSDTATWRRGVLRLERLRSAIFRWGWPNYSSAWGRGCAALAGLAFEDFPALDEVRCRFWKARSPSPEEAIRGDLPEGAWVSARLVHRRDDGAPLVAERMEEAPDAPNQRGSISTPKGAAAEGVAP